MTVTSSKATRVPVRRREMRPSGSARAMRSDAPGRGIATSSGSPSAPSDATY
jgi:hypothetical protein